MFVKYKKKTKKNIKQIKKAVGIISFKNNFFLQAFIIDNLSITSAETGMITMRNIR